ncbi:MAG: serine hydrolase [Minicystis sp.]
MLRLLVEQEQSLSFEDYLRRNITIPAGIHDMDCTKDPEHSEVFAWNYAPGDPSAPGARRPFVNLQCNSGGILGTGMALLNVFNAVRQPGMLNANSLAEFRAAPMTFYVVPPDPNLPAWQAAMMGGGGSSKTWIVQFPSNPNDPTHTAQSLADPGKWTTGVQAILFGNFVGEGIPPIVSSMKDFPQ